MGFSKVRTGAANKGGLMQVGSLYSCKWMHPFHNKESGWDILLFLGKSPKYFDENGDPQYMFFDVLEGQRFSLSKEFAKHCKEINKETTCTR